MTYRIHRPIFGAGALDAIIRSLAPAAWFRQGDGITVTGSGVSMWADAADSDNALVLPGVAGNSASTPDSVPLSIVGDIEFIFLLSATNYKPGADCKICVKRNATTSWDLGIQVTSGRFAFYDGVGTLPVATAPTATDGQPYWFKFTVDVDNGSGGKTVTLYQANYSVSVPTSWTTVGSAAGLAAGAITDTAESVYFGVFGNGTSNPLSGRIYRAIIKNGIDGTTVFDANFAAQPKGTLSFAESALGATVTVNQSGALPAHIGSQKDLLQGTDANRPAYSNGIITFDGVDNYLKTNAFALNQPTTVYLVVNPVSWTDADVLFGSQAGTTAYVRQDTATPQIEAYAGTASSNDSNLAVGAYAVLTVVFNGASSSLRVNNNAEVTGNFGAGVLGGLTLGAAATPANYANIGVKEVVLFPVAHDADTQSRIRAGLMARHGVA